MDLKQIEAFLTVMSTSSMTRAGQLLERSQSAVTRQIQELEEELGFTLFHRNGPKLVATSQAHQLRVDAERTVKASHQFQVRARDLLHGQDGRLRVAAIPNIACALVPAALARLPAGMLPDTYEVASIAPDEVVKGVFSQEYQLGLVNFPLDYRGLDVLWLGEAGCVAVLPADSPLAAETAVSVRALGAYPLITHRASALVRARIDVALKKAGIETDNLIEVNSPLVALQMVRAGLGVAVLEPFTATSLPLDGIVTRPLDAHVPFYVGLIAARGVPRADNVLALVGAIEEVARELLPSYRRHEPDDSPHLL